MFTRTDKALLDRTARMLDVKAKDLRQVHSQLSWGANKNSRKAKDEYDRLQRDARDLRELAKRLIKKAGVSTEAGATNKPMAEEQIDERLPFFQPATHTNG